MGGYMGWKDAESTTANHRTEGSLTTGGISADREQGYSPQCRLKIFTFQIDVLPDESSFSVARVTPASGRSSANEGGLVRKVIVRETPSTGSSVGSGNGYVSQNFLQAANGPKKKLRGPCVPVDLFTPDRGSERLRRKVVL